jgi:MFS family permease
MTARFFLGAIECGFGPGLPLYLSFFYPRHEIGLRIGLFLAGSALANAYGGALAYGLSHITSRIAPWRLLFILEGVPTCLLAVVTWFWLPDSPGTAKFLREEERKVAVARA